MQVTIQDITDIVKAISVKIPAEQVDAEIERFFAGIQKKVEIEGFRAGRAPMNIVKKSYGDTMRAQVTQYIYETTYLKALEKYKINPVSAPTNVKFEVLKEGTPFRYSAMFEVLPEIHVKDYTGLIVTKEKYLPNPEIVEMEIGRMQENLQQLVPVDEDAAVERGHTVIFDYDFSVEGHPEMDASAEGAMLELGTHGEFNRLMPTFGDQLIGMKCGDSKDISVPQPEVARGREGLFQVTVKEIMRKELPELDDDFARRCGECETMEALRESMTRFFRNREMERIGFDLQDRLVRAMIERNPLEVPQSMVNFHLDNMLENFKERLENQQATMEMVGFADDENFRRRFRESAEQKVKGDLLLMAVAEKENLAVSENDLSRRYELIADGNSAALKEIREYYAANSEAMNSLLADIKLGKAIRFLQDNAVITEVERLNCIGAEMDAQSKVGGAAPTS